jgi:RNA polymerase sigma-70 factor (ECF subfamily)
MGGSVLQLRVVERSPKPEPEAELVARAQRGEAEAWARLYGAHAPHVYRYLGYLVGDPSVVEDLAQETFVRALAGIRAFKGRASVATWLDRIALNVARHYWRRTRTRERASQSVMQLAEARHVPSVADTHADRAGARALFALLDELEPVLREAFILRELLGLSASETAERLEISHSNVAVRLYRARRRLREELVRQGWRGEESR